MYRETPQHKPKKFRKHKIVQFIKLGIMKEMDKLLEVYRGIQPPKLNQEEITILSRVIKKKKNETALKRLLNKKQKPRSRWIPSRALPDSWKLSTTKNCCYSKKEKRNRKNISKPILQSHYHSNIKSKLNAHTEILQKNIADEHRCKNS